VADFLDITGLEVNLDGEPILELVKSWRVEHRGRVVLRESLLGRSE
jgi:hypothetical protein